MPLLAQVVLSALAAAGEPAELPRVLFLTHSAGYEHGVVKRESPRELSLAEAALVQWAEGRFEVTATQDCARIAGDALDEYDCVVFYTTGDLPIAEADKRGLLEWIREGGAFVGVHCATDTFMEWEPYTRMIGGIFDGHPWTQAVGLRIEDPDHPAVRHLGERCAWNDEIYQFRAFRRHPTNVLISLDTATVEAERGKRADGDYAIAWCKPYGAGRVFYTALGHRPAVWRDERFRTHLLEGIDWAVGGEDHVAKAPEDAAALTERQDPTLWFQRGGGEARWKRVGSALEVVPGTGDLITRDLYGDALIHVEFRLPEREAGAEPKKANSGVYLQGRYELQVLDSRGDVPGPGVCGALYGVKPPDLDVALAAGEWQSFDVEFRSPRFSEAGAKTADARVTVWHNGVRVHDDVAIPKPTGGALTEKESEAGPLMLQDHGVRVRFRNVWIRPLGR